VSVATDKSTADFFWGSPMFDTIRIQDLAADEIRELLTEEGSELDEQQAAALQEFITEIGGLENALSAIAMLSEMEEAA